MTPVHLIAAKRDGKTLTDHEISTFLRGFTDGSIPDYQMSALAMAIYFRGMEPTETAALTRAMLESGVTLTWPAKGRPKGDKHSTGGIGDKVSLVLAPLLACAGIDVPMISGRGLGPTGGTLDKLESIPGFRTDLSLGEFQRIAQEVGCVISGATSELAPADKKLYALRDVTGTVPSIPLITASILSKKLAAGLDALVLDVKWGSGAFMKSRSLADDLAQSLTRTGQAMGLPISALVTDMNQPLGSMVGNAVEVDESVETLAGHGLPDLLDVTLTLGGELLRLLGNCTSREAGVRELQLHLESGRGLDKFEQMVRAQGGSLSAPRPRAPAHVVTADRAGTLGSMDAQKIGELIIDLGGGRRLAGESIDHSVGLQMHVRIGDPVHVGTPLATLFSRHDAAESAGSRLRQALTVDESPGA